MATAAGTDSIKGLSSSGEEKINGTGMRVAVIRTRWNEKIVSALTTGCKEQLIKRGVAEEDITLYEVPGSFELPLAASMIIKEDPKIDAVVCIGCLIKGETMHFEYICDSVSQALMRLGLDTGVPVIFGVLTCLTEHQALARAGLVEGHHNHGPEWGDAAISMAQLKATIAESAKASRKKRAPSRKSKESQEMNE